MPDSQRDTFDAELFKALFSLLPDGVVIIDPLTALPLQFNPAAHQQLGYSATEFAALRIPDYEAEETPEQTREHIENILLHGQDDFETRHRRKDGSLIDINVSVLQMSMGSKFCILCIYRDISKRKQAELKLQRSESLLSSIVGSIPVTLFLKQADTLRFEMLNRAGEELLGLSQQDVVGKNDYDLFTAEQADFFTANDRAVLASHQLKDIADEPIQTCNGETRRLHTRKIGIYDTAGQPTHLLGVSIDITARRAMEEELHTSTERLNEAQRLAQVGSWELDLATGKLIWSDEIFRLCEIDKNQFGATYEAFLNVIHPEDRDSVDLAYRHSLETRAAYEITHRLLMSDGRIKWVHERCNSDFDTNGKPLRSVGTVQDITVNMLAQAELTRSKRQYEELTERIPVGVYTFRVRVDGSMAFDYVSPRFCQQMDVPGEDIRVDTKTVFSLVHPDDLDEFIRLNQEVGCSLQPFLWEGRFIIRGETRWFRIESAATRQENGDSLWNGVVSNISESKHADAALNQLNEELEQRVEARTIALLRAKDEAERANNAKSEFLSRMSHELRTPLNAILGFGQLLESDALNPLTTDQLENIHEILRAGSHLLALINEVLDLARIESGRLDFGSEAVSIAPLVDECTALMQSLIAQRNIRLTSATNGGYAVKADRLRLRQVLLNLLSNAIKYNHEGGSIKITNQAMPQDRIRITVHDSGRGISADALARLFQPFERLESSYDGIEGTGIGLALSKKLTEAMDGSIGVESVVGQGSTFWVEFPLATTEAALPASASELPEPGICATARTLLYIEDNPANLRLVQKIINSRKGLALLDAHTAELGLEIARARQPDLILLDINLPGMDGHEALRHLQNNPATRHIPVVAITANAMERDIRKGLDAGFVAYLTKPLQIPGFIALLDEMLEPASGSKQAMSTGG